MRSNQSPPGNPWPHDMVITVEDRPSALLDLLWIREAHGLRPRADGLPPALIDAPAPVIDPTVTAATRSVWEEAWPRIWNAAAACAGVETDPRAFERFRLTESGSVERAEILQRMMGPTWRHEFGDSALDHDSYVAWIRDGMEEHLKKLPRRLEDHPERRDLAALVPAWRAGLTKIVTIPCVGEFAWRVAPNALLMTDATRDDSGAYRRALDSFNRFAR